MPQVTLFAGVDGGGSKTLAVVVDGEGQERGRGTAGSSNYAAVGLDPAIAEIRAAISKAARAAGSEEPIAAAWIGLAGVDRPADHDALLPHLRQVAGRVQLTNDADLVLTALPDAVGIAAITGTGSIMRGRDARGTAARVGGWGHIIGDEGSGYELGRLALQAASRAADGRGPATTLVDAILRTWNLRDPGDMISQVYHHEDKAAIARLSSLVFEQAQDGDSVARKLVDRAAAELALGIVTVSHQLDFADGPLPLALAGGLLTGEPHLRGMVLRRVRRRRPVGPVEIVTEPASSAARAAIRLVDERKMGGDGWSATPSAAGSS